MRFYVLEISMTVIIILLLLFAAAALYMALNAKALARLAQGKSAKEENPEPAIQREEARE